MSVTSTFRIEMQFAGTAGAWTDVTEDVVQSAGISVSGQGIGGVGPTKRVAGAGALTFSMNNADTNSAGKVGYYSPGHVNCRSGFEAGIPVRLYVIYDASSWIKFYGRIASDGIKILTGVYGDRRVEVEARDFMEQTAIHDMYLPELVENKRIDEMVPLVIANMPIQPLSATYNTGEDTFTTGFDTTSAKTKAMTELHKLAMSELGFIYVRPDINYNERLIVEGRMTRTNTPAMTVMPKARSLSGFLLQENGDFLLQETGGKIILNELTTIDLENKQLGMDVVNGANIANIVRGISYPRSIDTSPAVLFTLNSPIEIAAGETKTGYAISYKDPNNLASSVTGKDMITPVATVDYAMYSDRAGTDVDLTTNLSVTADYGAAGAVYSFSNAGTAGTAYITHLQARGKGIYTYEPVTYLTEDTASQLIHGSKPLDIDMKYQDNPTVSEAFADIVLNQMKDAVTEATSVTYIANTDDSLMGAFLVANIGNKVHLCEDVSGVEGDYFIHGIDFSIHPGNIIEYTWTVKRASIDIFQFWYLGIAGSSELGETTYLYF